MRKRSSKNGRESESKTSKCTTLYTASIWNHVYKITDVRSHTEYKHLAYVIHEYESKHTYLEVEIHRSTAASSRKKMNKKRTQTN